MKSYIQILLSLVLDKMQDGKLEALCKQQLKTLLHFSNGQDTFSYCTNIDNKKSSSKLLVSGVSPPNALIYNQIESGQKFTLKDLKMQNEVLDIELSSTIFFDVNGIPGIDVFVHIYRTFRVTCRREFRL